MINAAAKAPDQLMDGDLHVLAEYVREIADKMGLRDWTIHVRQEPVDDSDACADIEIIQGRRSAFLRFDSGWSIGKKEELRNTVIHELLHAHTKPMQWVVNSTQDLLGIPVFSVINNAYSDAEEIAIDSIATAWAEALPLPRTDRSKGKA